MPSDPSATDNESPIERLRGPSTRNWSQPREPEQKAMKADAVIDLGWGRLLFGQTFDSARHLADELCKEAPGRRDLCVYLRDPHVVLSMAPDRLFLDPSHTYRIWPDRYRGESKRKAAVTIRPIGTIEEAKEACEVYLKRSMVCGNPENMLDMAGDAVATYHVAIDEHGTVVGSILGVDHVPIFHDPENGASIWSLAVDPRCHLPGVGQALVSHVIEHFFSLGRELVDLSVLHNNTEAIALYEKLGFTRVPAFCIKHKNPINEQYFVPPHKDEKLNPYAQIIADEARRRGVRVEIVDAEYGFMKLSLGGREVHCRESLSDLTSAVAMSRCDDKRVTRRILERQGIKVPAQAVAVGDEEDDAFLSQHGRIVVKPARGEQGQGITVDVTDGQTMRNAIAEARRHCEHVLLEQFADGDDVRVIVIDEEVVAAAVRRPAMITGDGTHTVRQTIEHYSRRRAAATGGESKVPLDAETERCVAAGGYAMDDVLPEGTDLQVRKTANLHTGGTIHDITAKLHTKVADDCCAAARVLGMPVVGLDLLMSDPASEGYVMIEANERPGLANHEPQPTAERFIEVLFPQLGRRRAEMYR